MYNIVSIRPSEWQEYPETLEFYENLANKPYCSDGKNAEGNVFTNILPKAYAIKKALIQPNPPHKIRYIVIDVDDSDTLHKTLKELSGVPSPHLIIQNPNNGHAHLVYKLKQPVFMYGKARSHPIRYLAKIEKGLRWALGGDKGYSGNLMKNPVNAMWRTYSVTTAPSEGYTLNELEERLIELVNFTEVHNSIKTNKAANDAGFGRNCSLFDRVRVEAYKIGGGTYRALLAEILPIAKQINNDFEEPLLPNEVKHIATSIARYCSKTDFSKSHKSFSELQSKRSKAYWGDNTDKVIQAQKWASEGVNLKVIAEKLQVNRRTLTRWGIQKNKK